jgi:AraC-like DNA-binding protein
MTINKCYGQQRNKGGYMIEEFNVPMATKLGLNSELVPYYCGLETCTSGHSWGPGVRDHYLIHYIVKGKGLFKIHGNNHELKAGQGFLISPGVISCYQAHFEEPWEYMWVGFHGIKASEFLKRAGLQENSPVFTCNRGELLEECLSSMIDSKEKKYISDIKLTGLLYQLIAILVECNTNHEESVLEDKNMKEYYFHKALEYIYKNYSRKTTILEIANHIGIDRRYLHSLFKNNSRYSPQEFLIRYRIERACDIMKNQHLSIMNISASVGYEDPLLFSKIFKKIKGECPTTFRKNMYG